MTAGVVRVGDTVRRPRRPWSASVDALLAHLEAKGFDGAPRAVGYDERGRQVITYVSGVVDADPGDLDVARLRDVGRLIRRLHDATEDFVPPRGSVWNVAIAPDRDDLICHHDLAPWNLVRTATSLIFIDWDGAGPGSRLWDLAYAAHGFTPLSPRAGLKDDEAAERLGALVGGYEVSGDDARRLVDLLAPRIRSMEELLGRGGASGAEPWRTLWEEGHGDLWRDDAAYTDERRSLWIEAVR